MMEVCSREEDKAFAGIVLWLLVTDQEAHVSIDGDVRVRHSRYAGLRRKRRNAEAPVSAANDKRARKAAKLAALAAKGAINGTR